MSDQFPKIAVSLPSPRDMEKISQEAALTKRRSIREYMPKRPLSL